MPDRAPSNDHDERPETEHWVLMVYMTPSAGIGLSHDGATAHAAPRTDDWVERIHDVLDPLVGTEERKLSIAIECTAAATDATRLRGELRGDRFWCPEGNWSRHAYRRNPQRDVPLGGLASFIVWTRTTVASEDLRPTRYLLVILGDLLDVQPREALTESYGSKAVPVANWSPWLDASGDSAVAAALGSDEDAADSGERGGVLDLPKKAPGSRVGVLDLPKKTPGSRDLIDIPKKAPGSRDPDDLAGHAPGSQDLDIPKKTSGGRGDEASPPTAPTTDHDGRPRRPIDDPTEDEGSEGPAGPSLTRVLGSEPRARVFERARRLAESLEFARASLAAMHLPTGEFVVDLLAMDDPTLSHVEVAFQLRHTVRRVLATQVALPRAEGPLPDVASWILGEHASLVDACQAGYESLATKIRRRLESDDDAGDAVHRALGRHVVERGHVAAVLDTSATLEVGAALDAFGAELTRAIDQATPAVRRSIYDRVIEVVSVIQSSCDLHRLADAVGRADADDDWVAPETLLDAAKRLRASVEASEHRGTHDHLHGRTVYLPVTVPLSPWFLGLDLLQSAEAPGWPRMLAALRRLDAASPVDDDERAELEALARIRDDIAVSWPRTPPRTALGSAAGFPAPPVPWGLLLYMPADGSESVVLRSAKALAQVAEARDAGDAQHIRVAALADFPRRSTAEVDDDPYSDGVVLSFGGPSTRGPVPRQELGRVDSGSARLLTDFVIWGARQCPSHRLAMVVTGRTASEDRGGPFLVCHDRQEDSSLTLGEFTAAIRAGLDEVGRETLDLLMLDVDGLLTLEVAHELRSVARSLVAGDEATGHPDYGQVIRALDQVAHPPEGSDLRRTFDELVASDRPLDERRKEWNEHVRTRAAEALLGDATGSARPIVLPLGRIEALSRRVDTVTRLLFRHLREPEVWDALLGALEVSPPPVMRRQQLGRTMEALGIHMAEAMETQGSFAAMCRVLGLRPTEPEPNPEGSTETHIRWVGRGLRRLGGALSSPRAFEGQQDLWDALALSLELPPEPKRNLGRFMQALHDNLTRATRSGAAIGSHVREILAAIESLGRALAPHYGALSIYGPLTVEEQNHRGYLELQFHQQVHLYALLSAVRVLTTHAPHQLWDMIAVSMTHATGQARRDLLARLTGVPSESGALGPAATQSTTQSQFASIVPPPALTLSIEDHVPDDDFESPSDLARYRVRLTSTESSATLPQAVHAIDPRSFEQTLSSFETVLHRPTRSSAHWDYLCSLGRSLGEDIVGRLRDDLLRLREQLVPDSPGKHVHLSLRVPRALMRYPWELMSDGHGLVAERFAVGRQVWTDRRGARTAARRGDGVLRALVVGDVRSLPPYSLPPLPGARDEARAVAELLSDLSRELGPSMDFHPRRDVFIDTPVSRAAMRRLLRERSYDIVHFAGHGMYHSSHPERSGWILSDGPLWASELRNTLAWSGSPPWLVYANACNVAMTSDRAPSGYSGDVYGLATACIDQGVGSFIAPLWPVGDQTARVMATTFYEDLLLQRATLGGAMRKARLRAKDAGRRTLGAYGTFDISWASMVLYGDPGDRWFDALGRDARV